MKLKLQDLVTLKSLFLLRIWLNYIGLILNNLIELCVKIKVRTKIH